ncbi:hypothetical protein [Frigoriglobus tundricola]|uniref:Uncharacterized protein n=1 Tax=Frigoriglobus tundricola TaxID=2774151 RepID=A0A6M5YGW8_9BACT|nr:hypothetical protein [Frigoriglobus tundricola]QJW93238.1 hypothetical protein FTUN_0743 [Frigoriglobus tundricola]
MAETRRQTWLWWLLRPSLRRLTVLAALAAVGWAYLTYFTPEQRVVRQHLGEADAKSEKAIDARLQPLAKLFAKGRTGSKAFAEEALSWDSKWHLLKATVRGDESHRIFLSDAFARHVFSPDELREALEGAVAAYLDDIDGFEAEMLVRLRADLADPARPDKVLPAHLEGEKEFRLAYQTLSGRLVDELHLDLGVTVGRELGLMIASDVAAQTALQAAKAAAAEMGVNAGVLSTGAVSTVATLGLGMIAALILDYVLDEVFKLAGYDPAAKIEALVVESLDKMEAALIRDSGPFWLDKTGSLRLRMEQLHESRSKLRRETILRLLKQGGN